MTTTQQLVVGAFRDHIQAEQAINELLQAGFDHHQIRFAGRGISTGGILEKIKSLFTGQEMSASGVYDDLVKMGAPPEDARYYQSEFEAGRSIVAVLATSGVQEAINILVRHGGYGASQRFAPSADYGKATGVQQPVTTEDEQRMKLREEEMRARKQSADYGKATGVQQPVPAEDEQRMKLREEEMRVRKQSVEAGEARVHKDVVIEQKSVDVPVTHEEVYIERRPGSGLPSDQPISQGETYRIPVHEEQVTVEKQPVEREEVSFGKRPVQETQRVTDTVRREEAHIEQAGDVNVQEKDVEQGRDIGRGRGVRRRGKDIEDQPMP
jgi:uncharacterized protein (TIGR02271 family)